MLLFFLCLTDLLLPFSQLHLFGPSSYRRPRRASSSCRSEQANGGNSGREGDCLDGARDAGNGLYAALVGSGSGASSGIQDCVFQGLPRPFKTSFKLLKTSNFCFSLLTTVSAKPERCFFGRRLHGFERRNVLPGRFALSIESNRQLWARVQVSASAAPGMHSKINDNEREESFPPSLTVSLPGLCPSNPCVEPPGLVLSPHPIILAARGLRRMNSLFFHPLLRKPNKNHAPLKKWSCLLAPHSACRCSM